MEKKIRNRNSRIIRNFTIPKRESTNEKFKTIGVKTSEYQRDYLPIITKSLYNHASFSNLKIDRFKLVLDEKLQSEFTERKKELKFLGRNDRELQDGYAFYLCKSYAELEELSTSLPKVNNVSKSVLGHPEMGVCLQKHFDVLSSEPIKLHTIHNAILYKYIKGKVKTVAENHSGSNHLEPSPQCDVHLSKNTLTQGANLKSVYYSSQIYLYEYGDDGIEQRPRHICPYGVITFTCTAQLGSSNPQPVKKISVPKPIVANESTQFNVWNGLLKVGSNHLSSVGLFSYAFGYKPTRVGNSISVKKSVSESDVKKFYLGNLTRLSMRRQCPTLNHFLMYFEVKCRSSSNKGHQSFLDFYSYLKTTKKIGVAFCENNVQVLLLPTCELTQQLGIEVSANNKQQPVLHSIFVYHIEIGSRLTSFKLQATKGPLIDEYDSGYKTEIPFRNKIKTKVITECFEQQAKIRQNYLNTTSVDWTMSSFFSPPPVIEEQTKPIYSPAPERSKPKDHLVCNELCSCNVLTVDHLMCNQKCLCPKTNLDLDRNTLYQIGCIAHSIKNMILSPQQILSKLLSQTLLKLILASNSYVVFKCLTTELAQHMNPENVAKVICTSVQYYFSLSEHFNNFQERLCNLVKNIQHVSNHHNVNSAARNDPRLQTVTVDDIQDVDSLKFSDDEDDNVDDDVDDDVEQGLKRGCNEVLESIIKRPKISKDVISHNDDDGILSATSVESLQSESEDDADDNDSYLETVLNFANKKLDISDFKLSPITFEHPPLQISPKKKKLTQLALEPRNIPLESTASVLHDPRLISGIEIEDLDNDGTVTSTTSLDDGLQQPSTSSVSSFNIEDTINRAVASTALRVKNALPEPCNALPEPCNAQPQQTIPNIFDTNFALNSSVMEEVKKLSAALSKSSTTEVADGVSSTNDSFGFYKEIQDTNKQLPAPPVVPDLTLESSTVDNTVKDMLHKFGDKMTDVLKSSGMSLQSIKGYEDSLKRFEEQECGENDHLMQLSKSTRSGYNCGSEFESVINAATEHFLTELGKLKRIEYFYIYNHSHKTIGLTLQKHLEFFLRMKELNMGSIVRDDYNFNHNVSVYVHKDDVPYVDCMPDLLWFKNIPYSKFYLYDDIKHVDNNHSSLDQLFPDGGIIISTTSYFATIHSNTVDSLLKEMVRQNKQANAVKWFLCIHSGLFLHLSKFDSREKALLGDVQETLISYGEHHIWEVMTSHACDSTDKLNADQDTATSWLTCSRNMQQLYMHKRRHVILLSDQHSLKPQMSQHGIDIKNILDMIRFLQKS